MHDPLNTQTIVFRFACCNFCHWAIHTIFIVCAQNALSSFRKVINNSVWFHRQAPAEYFCCKNPLSYLVCVRISVQCTQISAAEAHQSRQYANRCMSARMCMCVCVCASQTQHFFVCLKTFFLHHFAACIIQQY